MIAIACNARRSAIVSFIFAATCAGAIDWQGIAAERPMKSAARRTAIQERAVILDQVASLLHKDDEAILFSLGSIAIGTSEKENPTDVRFDRTMQQFNSLWFFAIDRGRFWNQQISRSPVVWAACIGARLVDSGDEGRAPMRWAQYIGFKEAVPFSALESLDRVKSRKLTSGTRDVFVVHIDSDTKRGFDVYVFQIEKNVLCAVNDFQFISYLQATEKQAQLDRQSLLTIKDSRIEFRGISSSIDAMAKSWGMRVFGVSAKRAVKAVPDFLPGDSKAIAFSYGAEDTTVDVFYSRNSSGTAVDSANKLFTSLFGRAVETVESKGEAKVRIRLRPASAAPNRDGAVTAGEACLGLTPFFGLDYQE